MDTYRVNPVASIAGSTEVWETRFTIPASTTAGLGQTRMTLVDSFNGSRIFDDLDLNIVTADTSPTARFVSNTLINLQEGGSEILDIVLDLPAQGGETLALGLVTPGDPVGNLIELADLTQTPDQGITTQLAAGVREAQITVQAIRDAMNEGTETGTLALANFPDSNNPTILTQADENGNWRPIRITEPQSLLSHQIMMFLVKVLHPSAFGLSLNLLLLVSLY